MVQGLSKIALQHGDPGQLHVGGRIPGLVPGSSVKGVDGSLILLLLLQNNSQPVQRFAIPRTGIILGDPAYGITVVVSCFIIPAS